MQTENLNNSIEMLRKFWAVCAFKYAHLIGHEMIKDNERIHNEYVFDHVDWNGKTVLDYGCGGGEVGKYLFQNKNIFHYHGVDIALRSIIYSDRKLQGYPVSFDLSPIDFKSVPADIFLCLACIQHFPTLDYLNNFLNNVNGSGIKTVILQIRRTADEETLFSFNDAYNGGGGHGHACLTRESYVSKILTKYKLIKTTHFEKLDYEYLFFEVK